MSKIDARIKKPPKRISLERFFCGSCTLNLGTLGLAAIDIRFQQIYKFYLTLASLKFGNKTKEKPLGEEGDELLIDTTLNAFHEIVQRFFL